jgi:hypothetical protein
MKKISMKKILPAIVLGILVTGLLVPVIASAQVEGPKECCKIRRDFTVKLGGADKTFKAGAVVGKKDGVCPGVTLTANLDIANTCPSDGKCYLKDWSIVCMLNVIYTATNWLFMIIMLIAVIMIVVGGFTYMTASGDPYMTASGDPEKAGKGKTIIVYALIGIAIALFAKVFPAIVRFIMGV